MADRISNVSRKTRETDIELSFTVDGTGSAKVNTGIGFFFQGNDSVLQFFRSHLFSFRPRMRLGSNADRELIFR